MKTGDKVRIKGSFPSCLGAGNEGKLIKKCITNYGSEAWLVKTANINHGWADGFWRIVEQDLVLLEETMKTTVSLKELVDAGICARGLLYAMNVLDKKGYPFCDFYEYDIAKLWPDLNPEAQEWLGGHRFGVEQEYKPKQDVEVQYNGMWAKAFVIKRDGADGRYYCCKDPGICDWYKSEDIRPIESK